MEELLSKYRSNASSNTKNNKPELFNSKTNLLKDTYNTSNTSKLVNMNSNIKINTNLNLNSNIHKIDNTDLKEEIKVTRTNDLIELGNKQNLEKNLVSSKQGKNGIIGNNKVNIGIDEDFINDEFDNIIKKNDDIMKKYCTLYDYKNDAIKIKSFKDDFIEKKNRSKEFLNTTGKDWFNMKATEMTPEVEGDLMALKLRHIINPRRFYKKADSNNLPKFFQLGTLETNIMMGKKYRMKKSEVKNSLAEEFLQDDKDAGYTSRKFKEIQVEKSYLGRKKAKMNEYKMKNKSKGKKGSSYISK